MVQREGLEPPTLWVETICAIHCATAALIFLYTIFFLKNVNPENINIINMAKGNNSQRKEKKKPKQPGSKSSQKGANKKKN